jgi:hypothetical protein
MLFGHQNDANQTDAPSTAPNIAAPQDPGTSGLNPLAVDPATGVSLPTATTDAVASVDTAQEEPSILNQSSVPGYSAPTVFAADPAPTTPFGNNQAAAPIMDTPPQPETVATNTTSLDLATPDQATASTPQPSSMGQLRLSNETSNDTLPTPNDLLDIKQQALSQLGPLVSQLEQDPEEKFRTTMMLIQSTDNSALLKDAYAAAQAISDERVRAQALLDIVNEINYFTQQQSSDPQSQSVTTM